MPTGVMCPKDGGEHRRAPLEEARHGFYACSTTDCDFVVWNKPVHETCPECGYVGAEMKFTKARGDYRKCLKCGNEWDVAAPEERVEAAEVSRCSAAQ